MIVSFKKIEEFSKRRVRFYTAQLGENELSEFEYFTEKEYLYKTHFEEMKILYNSIEQIQLRGAKQYYFVPEGEANYLPVVGANIKRENKIDYGVRLYCIRLRDDLVVLLNGDIKTQLNPKQCKNVSLLFSQALAIAKGLDKALIAKDINYNEEDPFESINLEI